MKTSKFLLKSALLSAVLLVGLSRFSGASAQAIIFPGMPDNFLGQPSGYPNSSTIDYSPFCTGGMACTGLPLAPQLTAVVTDAGMGGPGPWLFVSDQVTAWIPIPINAPPGSSPDVIVGNDIINPGNYIIGVVVTMGGNVMLFLYSVKGVGIAPGSLIVNPMPPCFISVSGNDVGPAHIDIEAQYSTLYWAFPGVPPGLPLSNNFAITWQDNTPGSGIMGYFGSLNAPCAGITQVINPGPTLSSPDVAIVERLNTAGVFEDWALFSYVDLTVSPNLLYYQEWLIPGPPSPAVLLDNANTYFNINPLVSVARIDAIDDYTQNSTGGGNAYFDIVASAFIGGTEVLEYNNLDVPGFPFVPGVLPTGNITAPIPPLAIQRNFVPQVACGPGSVYTVAYFTAGAFLDYMATAIKWGTGIPVPPGDAYQVNSFPWAGSPGFPAGIAVSGTCNNDVNQQVFAGWESNSVMWDKYSPTAAPYAFKQPKNNTAAITSTNEWQLSPNPAADHVILTAPIGFTTDNETVYRITDLSGKVLHQSNISNSIEQINVNDLPAGMYMLSIYGRNVNTKTIKFVKE